MKLMKAIVYHNDGSPDILKLEEIEKPTPGDDEVLIKVRAASVNPIDSGSSRHPFLRRILFAMSRSKINRPGRDVAGQVEAVGSNVTQFKPGGRGIRLVRWSLCRVCMYFPIEIGDE